MPLPSRAPLRLLLRLSLVLVSALSISAAQAQTAPAANAENNAEAFGAAFADVKANLPVVPVLGITGTGGAGKSSMVDELVRRFLIDFPEKRIALVSVDPSKRKTGGALLGDRIRMNAIHSDRVYMRSLATRQSNLALSRHVQEALDILKAVNDNQRNARPSSGWGREAQ